MNELKLAERALKYLDSVEAFTAKEVPVYIKELLEFKIFEHLLNYFDDFLLTIPLAILGFVIYKKVTKWLDSLDKESYRYSQSIGLNYLALSLVIPFLLSVMANHELINAYKAYKAPRVYLIDYFKGELNNASTP